MNWNEKLLQLDTEFTNIHTGLDELINNISFEHYNEFTLSDNVDESFYKEYNFKGIYKIDIQIDNSLAFEKWLSDFIAIWEHEAIKYHFVPNSRKKRTTFHKTNPPEEWLPIYLGKARNVSSRIYSHLNLKLKQPTTGLKLLERKDLYGKKFRVSAIELPVKSYDTMVPKIEKKLRDRYNPIFGRQ